MATETLELKTPEQADSLPKEEDGVADSTKEAQVSEDAEKGDEVAKAETEGEEDDGESKEAKTSKRGQSSEKEPVTPVSERPTRERKRTERYILDTPSRPSGSKAVSIEQGRGTRLKEIPNVAYKLSKRKPDDNLFLLHTILYGKKGKAQTVKKNIGQFSGFVWIEQEEEKQRARTKEKLEKCIKEKLIDFCEVLDIPINKSNVKKEELAVSVLEFLLNPKATRDILLADSEKKTRKRKKSTTNVTSEESSDVPAKRRRQAKSGKNLDQPTKTEENGEADVGSEGINNSHGEDCAAPKKENNGKDKETEDNEAKEKTSTDKKSSSKRTKKGKPASEEEKSLKGSLKPGGKSSKKVTKSTSSSSKKQKVEKDDSSKEKGKKQTSKPQAKGSKDQGKGRKKGKREPTRKEMHVVVSKILKEVDFNTATLSDILRTLGSHFRVDLMHRKAEVKDIITDAINEMSDDEEKEENTEDEGEKAKEGKE